MYLLLTRLLLPEGYGIYISLLVVPLIAGSLVQMGMTRASIVELGRGEIPEKKIISTVFSVWIITSSAGIVLSILLYKILSNPDFSFLMIVLALMLLPLYLGVAYARGIYLGQKKINTSNRLIWAPFTLNTLFIVIFSWLAGWGITGAVAAFVVSYALVFIAAWIDIARKHKVRILFEKAVIRRMVRLGALFSLANLTFLLIYKIDIVILQKMLDATEVGIYSLAASLIEQIWLIPHAIGMVIMSYASGDADTERSKKETHRMLRLGLIFGTLIALALWFLMPWAIPFFFGSGFTESAQILRLLSPAIVIFIIARVLESYLGSQAKPQYAIYVFAPMVLLNILLNILLIPDYGIEGAALATLICYSLGSMIFVMVYCWKSHSSIKEIFFFRKNDFPKLFNKKRIE